MFDDTLQSRPWVMAHRTELQALLPYGWSDFSVKDSVCAGLAELGVPCESELEQRRAWRLLYERGLLETQDGAVRLPPRYFELLRVQLAQDRVVRLPRPWITEIASVATAMVVIAHGLLLRLL
jgi:hypothetical protein